MMHPISFVVLLCALAGCDPAESHSPQPAPLPPSGWMPGEARAETPAVSPSALKEVPVRVDWVEVAPGLRLADLRAQNVPLICAACNGPACTAEVKAEKKGGYESNGYSVAVARALAIGFSCVYVPPGI